MIYTTLNKIRDNHPCADGWVKLLSGLGKTGPDDEPLSIAQIAQINGLRDALWCLRSVPEEDKRWRLLAVRYARTVQHLMTDERSIAAIDVAERHAHGLATDDELAAASAAAAAAARTAASEAAAEWASASEAAAASAWAAAATLASVWATEAARAATLASAAEAEAACEAAWALAAASVWACASAAEWACASEAAAAKEMHLRMLLDILDDDMLKVKTE